MAKKPTETDLVAVRLPSTLIKRIDRWAKKAGRTNRSEAIRALIDAGLEAKEGPPAPVWAAKLDELAARLNTDAAGAVDVLAEYLEAPEAPAPPTAKAKQPKKGLGQTLRSWIL